MEKKTIDIITQIALIAVFAFFALACATQRGTPAPTTPTTFVASADGGGWSTIMIRDGLSYDVAYDEVLDVVAKRYEMDMISKEGGYGRSKWIFTKISSNDITLDRYKTRVMFKFTADKSKVDIKTDSQWNSNGVWVNGYDTEVLQTLKQDIEGVVGRTVR